MPLFLDCCARVMARPQQHVLAAVLRKAVFRAAAPELGAGVPRSKFSSSAHVKTGLKYSLFLWA